MLFDTYVADFTVSKMLVLLTVFQYLKICKVLFSNLLSYGVICEKYMLAVATCFVFLEKTHQKYLYPFMSKPCIISRVCFE